MPTDTPSRSGSAGLTWGQYWIWDALDKVSDSSHFCITHFQRLSPGMRITEATVRHALQRLTERHESLRTTYGRSSSAEPVQRLHEQVTVPFDVLRMSADEAVVAAVSAELAGTTFSFDDVPLRATLVVVDGRPRGVALRLSRMALDAWGLHLLQAELDQLLRAAPADAARDRLGWQPFDQAAWERSAEGASVSARALDNWYQQLHRFTQSMFRRPPLAPATPRFCVGELTSSAVPVAARLLAQRHRCPPSAVVLAAIASVLGIVLQTSTVGFSTMVSNRHLPRTRGMIAPLAQTAPMCVAVEGRPFGDLIQSTWRASVQAQRHGLYDLAQFSSVKDRVTRERGADFEVSCVVNLVVAPPPEGSDKTPGSDEAELASLRRHTVFSWKPGLAEENIKLALMATLDADELRLTVRADTAAVAPESARTIAEAVETLLVAAVAGQPLYPADVANLVPC